MSVRHAAVRLRCHGVGEMRCRLTRSPPGRGLLRSPGQPQSKTVALVQVGVFLASAGFSRPRVSRLFAVP